MEGGGKGTVAVRGGRAGGEGRRVLKAAGDLAGGLDQGCVGGGAAMRRVKSAAELRASGGDGEQAMRVIH